MNKKNLAKVTGTSAAAFLIAGTTAFTAFAAMPEGTVVIGNKAFSLEYANLEANVKEIREAVVAGGEIYVKAPNGTWYNNASEVLADASAIPAVEFKAADGTVTNYAAKDGEVASAELKVNSVSAINAKSFKVVFNNKVEDTAKVAFTVKRSTSSVTVTTTWNEAKTEATLTNSVNFPEGSYTVAVKNDTTDLGTSTVAISQQKIAKIEITSTKLSVVSAGTGYATYKVYDQYNNDISSSYLANNIKFQTGVGSATHKNGIITIDPTPGSNLIQFGNVVVTGYDTTSGVSVTATLATSTALGTLSDFKLGELDKVELTAGDVTSVFYVPYTALDMSGNETKSYDLVAGGLILNGGTLSVSNPNVQAQIVKDPVDSSKAAVELKVTNTGNILLDMPVTITAMTYTGKTSTITTTIKKANEVSTFTLLTPNYNIAVGDTAKLIPFEAYDQSGNKITKFDDLFGAPAKVTLNGVAPYKNVDGTASLLFVPQGTEGPQIISAIVNNTGKMSTLTLNIQKRAVAESLELDSTVFVNAMENTAVQGIDFGADAGGLKVKDQFGRDINMITGANVDNYKVAVESSSTQITVGGTTLVGTKAILESGDNTATLTANAANGASATVTFTLFQDKNNNGVQDRTLLAATDEPTIDTKSTLLSIIKSSDIKGYTLDAVSSPIYVNPNTVATLTARDKAYTANPSVYGKTASGAKVLLAGNPVVGAYVDNTANFTVVTTPGAIGLAYDGVKVAAGKIADSTKTGSAATLTVTVKDYQNALNSLTTSITSSTEAPKATTVGIDVTKYITGLSVIGDEVSIKQGNLANAIFVDGAYMAKYKADGTAPASISKVTFYAKDQYGKKAMQLAQFRVISSTGNNVSIDDEGKLSITGALAVNDEIVISAVASNGMIKTIKVKITL